MLCPKCKKGNYKIEHVKVDLPTVDKTIELPEFDFKLLNSLKIDEPQFASLLAQELDCYWQTVRSRVAILANKGLIEMKRETREERYGERNYYYLTEKAKETYFNSQT
jgi:predicted transcriptional regulator